MTAFPICLRIPLSSSTLPQSSNKTFTPGRFIRSLIRVSYCLTRQALNYKAGLVRGFRGRDAAFYQWLPGGMMTLSWGEAEKGVWTTVGPRESKNDCTAGCWKYWMWEQLSTGF